MSIISTDITKAKLIHKNNIRNSRVTKFQELDVEYQRAIEADNATKKTEIAAKKQALRDAPADSAIDAAKTEAELKAQWNTAILGTSPYN
jgi:recombinational DNA repair protein RecT